MGKYLESRRESKEGARQKEEYERVTRERIWSVGFKERARVKKRKCKKKRILEGMRERGREWR